MEQGAGSDIGGVEFVGDPIAVGICADTEALSGLHPQMLVERVNGELPNRDNRASLVKGQDHQGRGIRGIGATKGFGSQTFHAGCVPSAVIATREKAERNAFGGELDGGAGFERSP